MTFEPGRQVFWYLFICEDCTQAGLCPEPHSTLPGGPRNTESVPGATAQTPACRMARERMKGQASSAQSPEVTELSHGLDKEFFQPPHSEIVPTFHLAEGDEGIMYVTLRLAFPPQGHQEKACLSTELSEKNKDNDFGVQTECLVVIHSEGLES